MNSTQSRDDRSAVFGHVNLNNISFKNEVVADHSKGCSETQSVIGLLLFSEATKESQTLGAGVTYLKYFKP